MLKRKIYDMLVAWKNSSKGTTAMMIDGARRVGKSYIAEQFAKAEYKSYILIDFGQAPTDVLDLFVNDSADLDLFFASTAMFVLGVIVGIIGLLGMGVNYPIYKKLLAQGKQKYAFEIMELAKEISEK